MSVIPFDVVIVVFVAVVRAKLKMNGLFGDREWKCASRVRYQEQKSWLEGRALSRPSLAMPIHRHAFSGYLACPGKAGARTQK